LAVTRGIGDAVREIPSSDVRRVTRAGNRYRSGALWGGAIFGGLGLVSSASCSGGGCGNPLYVAIVSGTVGVLWGTAIGALIPKHPTVYESGAASTVRMTPMLARDRIGVALSANF